MTTSKYYLESNDTPSYKEQLIISIYIIYYPYILKDFYKRGDDSFNWNLDSLLLD